MPIELVYKLTAAELEAVLRHFQRTTLRRSSTYWVVQLFAIVMWIALTFAFLTASDLPAKQAGPGQQLMLAIGVAVASMFALSWAQWKGILLLHRDHGHHAGVFRTMVIGEQSITVHAPNGRAEIAWHAVTDIADLGGPLYLVIDHVTFLPVSASAFGSAEERAGVLALVRDRMHGVGTRNIDVHAATQPAPSSATGAPIPQQVEAHAFVPAPAAPSRWRNAADTLTRNIGYAFRLAMLRPVTEEKLAPRWWQLFAFTLLAILVPLAYAFLQTGPAGEPGLEALPGALLHIPLLMCAGIAAAYLTQQAEKSLAAILSLLLVAFATDVLSSLVSSALLAALPGRMAYRLFGNGPQVIWAVWCALAGAVALVRLFGPGSFTRMGVVCISSLLIAVPMAFVYRDRTLWHESYDDAKDAARERMNSSVTQEDIFYRQPALLERELAAVAPQRPGLIDVFYIGMAGYGYQDVFRKEVVAVKKLMEERFDAAGHTIQLVNSGGSVASTPIASVTSLGAALKRVSAVMDRDEDVLVLFLTSHGSEKHRFSLEMYPLSFNELTPAVLRSALDESGIKNRVIVVSACYSGGFIEPLMDENTLVISASAADRNSFGCGNENDWTYFGKAFFDEALRKTTSFTAAFQQARPLIAEREKAQEFRPSDPQIAEGVHIRETLARLDAQLAGVPRQSDKVVATNRVSDAAARYAELIYDNRYFETVRETCLKSMQAGSPDVVIKTQPATFGALSPADNHWPRLVGAWDKYAAELCDKTSDPAIYRDTFAGYLREAQAAEGADHLLKYFTTDGGRRWRNAESEATRRTMDAVLKLQTENQQRRYAAFLEEQARIYKAFDESRPKKQR